MSKQKSAREWMEDALGRYQVTHCHSSIREALKAMDVTENNASEVTPPKPIDTAEEATQEKCYICESSIEWPDDNDPSLAGKTSVTAKCGHYFRKRHPSPQAEPIESAGEVDDSVAQAIDILTNVPHKRQVYQQAERVYCHLVKRMFDECGSFKAQEFIRRVQSGEHDVPSPWAHQPSKLPQPEREAQSDSSKVSLPDSPLYWTFDGARARCRKDGPWVKRTEYEALREFANGIVCRLNQLFAAQSQPVQEMPTPVLDAINWLMGCGKSDFMKPEGAPRYWWRSKFAERAGLEYDRELQQFRKAQSEGRGRER